MNLLSWTYLSLPCLTGSIVRIIPFQHSNAMLLSRCLVMMPLFCASFTILILIHLGHHFHQPRHKPWVIDVDNEMIRAARTTMEIVPTVSALIFLVTTVEDRVGPRHHPTIHLWNGKVASMTIQRRNEDALVGKVTREREGGGWIVLSCAQRRRLR